MTKKLLYFSRLKFERYRNYTLFPAIVLLVLYACTISQMSAQNNEPFTTSQESIGYDFDECKSFSNDGSNYDYSEFTPSYGNSCTSITSGQLYRNSGKHSCTNDEAGNPGDAACFQSSLDNDYSPDHTLAIRFDVTLTGDNGKKGRLDGISFKQLAPHNYLWSAVGYANNTGPNNYPTKFAVRVLKDGLEILSMTDMATSQSWVTETLDFSNNAYFMVDAGSTSVYTFELYSYAPIGNGAAVSAWDLDDLKVFSSCEEECTLSVDAGEDLNICKNEEVTLTATTTGSNDCPTITSSYKITDSDTKQGCFYSDTPGVIFQKYDDCHAVEYVWRAGNDLTLNEYNNDTATIAGSVIDQNGRVAYVDIALSEKEHSGTTWGASCYVSGLSDPRTFYRSFTGAITVDGVPLTVGTRFNAHYILADGAGLDSAQYGLGAWTGGSFGSCTEWFGNLEPMQIDNSNNELTYLWSTGEITESITVTESGEYTVTVQDCTGCTASDTVVVKVDEVTVDAGEDQTLCIGEETTLTAEGNGDFEWSTGETTQSIIVSPNSTTEYSVIVTNGHCEATDEVIVTIEDKVVIGDYVWMDENRNGIQDDGSTGINGMSVSLYQCTNGSNTGGDLVESTETTDGPSGEAGYYQFKVCPDSGDYYIVFGDVPDELEFTVSNEGNDSMDSDADAGGATTCFTITDEDNLTIDAGLNTICGLNIEVDPEVKICFNETIELTATIQDETAECEGGCEYPIIEQDRCYGPTGNFEIWLVSSGNSSSFKFKASEQRFETLDDGTAKYTATASNGIDTIVVNAVFTGNTSVAGPNGPKANSCQDYDTSDWDYWSTWSGTITSLNHGVFNLSMKGTYFQMGVGADVTRSGFGASGWFYAEGGDGFYTEGDVNVVLNECIDKNATFKWTTEDGKIISDANQKTITIESPGTYIIEVVNCIDCVATKTVVVTENRFCSTFSKAGVSPKMASVYPIPAQSGSTLTIEFNKGKNSANEIEGPKAYNLKSSIENSSIEENISIVLYDGMGRVISAPRTFDLQNGEAIIHLDLNYIPSGRYIVKAQGSNWSESKSIIVK